MYNCVCICCAVDGILSAKTTFQEKPKATHIRHPSQDFLQEFTNLKSQLQGEGSESDVQSSKNGRDERRGSNLSVTSVSSSNSNTNSPLHDKSHKNGTSSALWSEIIEVPQLTNLDPSTFKNKTKPDPKVNHKRENFENLRGALFSNDSEGPSDIEDPLGSIDPLWTIKK